MALVSTGGKAPPFTCLVLGRTEGLGHALDGVLAARDVHARHAADLADLLPEVVVARGLITQGSKEGGEGKGWESASGEAAASKLATAHPVGPWSHHAWSLFQSSNTHKKKGCLFSHHDVAAVLLGAVEQAVVGVCPGVGAGEAHEAGVLGEAQGHAVS